MCKIVSIPGIKPSNRKNAWKFIMAITPIMSKHDEHGFGYAAFDQDGQLFGERWLSNKSAFKNRTIHQPLTELDQTIITEYGQVLIKKNQEPKYDTFGILSDDISAITLHARMATSGREFKNTHPFVEGDTSLIHNGVISNDTSLTKKYSTCDSEVILHEYLKDDVKSDVNNFQKVADSLRGYYALSILTKVDGVSVMDVVKDDRASLSAAYVKELQTIVFATSLSHIFEAAKKCKFKVLSHYEVKPESILRINALTGKVIKTASFKSSGYSSITRYKGGYGAWDDDVNSRTFSDMIDYETGVKKEQEFSRLHYSDLHSSHIDWFTEDGKTWKKGRK